MNQTRLDIEKNGLYLDYLTKEDTIGSMIEKINKNFREINSNGGGPKGPVGKPGRPGCPGIPGPPGKDGESELEWLGRISKSCDLSDHEELNILNDIILNKFTNRSVLLSNLEELTINETSELKRRNINEDSFTAFRVSDIFNDYKLKIYNSDENGLGKHIHFLNSKAVEANPKYLCSSGFTISLNWNPNNIETFKISGIENSDITNHTHNIEIEADLLTLKRHNNGQSLNFSSGTKQDNNSNRRLTFRLVDLTEQHVVSIPDRTGYQAVWQDVREHSEIWEYITKNDIKINHARYKIENNQLMDLSHNAVHLIDIDDTSYIKYKRLNNFVLVEYHIGLVNNQNQHEFNLNNIQLKVEKDIIGCLTTGWHTGTIMRNESYLSDEIINNFILYKLDSTNYNNKLNNTFIISYKLNNLNNVLFNLINNTYWLSGQVWATIQNPDCAIITFDIEQGALCPELNII